MSEEITPENNIGILTDDGVVEFHCPTVMVAMSQDSCGGCGKTWKSGDQIERWGALWLCVPCVQRRHAVYDALGSES